MKAKLIYERADSNGITLVGDCSSKSDYNKYMRNTTKANGKIIRKLIKKHCPDVYEALGLMFHNPFEYKCLKSNNVLVYTHSMIEYFFKIN